VVVEAKRLGAGIEGALAQAIGYVMDLSLSADVVVTDGLRYRKYAREKGFDRLRQSRTPEAACLTLIHGIGLRLRRS
jgi:hypothetical protein